MHIVVLSVNMRTRLFYVAREQIKKGNGLKFVAYVLEEKCPKVAYVFIKFFDIPLFKELSILA